VNTILILSAIPTGILSLVILIGAALKMNDARRERKQADEQHKRAQMYCTLRREHRVAEWCED